VKNDAWNQLLRRLSAKLAVQITEGVAPLFRGALTYLQDLKVYCPEAFDASGSLRPDWQEVVRAKLTAMQPVKTPEFHCELITRKKIVNLN
jgi:hypothetical protein